MSTWSLSLDIIQLLLLIQLKWFNLYWLEDGNQTLWHSTHVPLWLSLYWPLHLHLWPLNPLCIKQNHPPSFYVSKPLLMWHPLLRCPSITSLVILLPSLGPSHPSSHLSPAWAPHLYICPSSTCNVPWPFLAMWLSPIPHKILGVEDTQFASYPQCPVQGLTYEYVICHMQLYEYIRDWMQHQDKDPNSRFSISWTWGLQRALRARLNTSWPSGSSYWSPYAMSI